MEATSRMTVTAGPASLRSVLLGGGPPPGSPVRQTDSAVGSAWLDGTEAGTPGPCLTISCGRPLLADHGAIGCADPSCPRDPP
jgi:hypothetical protein